MYHFLVFSYRSGGPRFCFFFGVVVPWFFLNRLRLRESKNTLLRLPSTDGLNTSPFYKISF